MKRSLFRRAVLAITLGVISATSSGCVFWEFCLDDDDWGGGHHGGGWGHHGGGHGGGHCR